ncbi:MAG TPA: ribosomal protein S18-alanine N-acetyltransferase [Gammaproteobacteria bacterium]|nr:ribosomal protein S18-alanine N-acetyltransferase [Gammaproteobacteria bacterium]
MNAVLAIAAPLLRPLVPGDLERLAAIEARAYRSGWTGGIFADCLRVGYSCWGMEAAGVLAGYGIISIAAGESHLLNIAVDPTQQRGGLGGLMLEHLLGIARRWRVEHMFLEVRPSNVAARRLYERAGFAEFGRRRGYYPGGNASEREDALILRLQL